MTSHVNTGRQITLHKDQTNKNTGQLHFPMLLMKYRSLPFGTDHQKEVFPYSCAAISVTRYSTMASPFCIMSLVSSEIVMHAQFGNDVLVPTCTLVLSLMLSCRFNVVSWAFHYRLGSKHFATNALCQLKVSRRVSPYEIATIVHVHHGVY